MTDTDITPELVDAVADWWESRGAHAGVQRLRTEARHLAREQADEKRVDDLARVSYAAESDAARGHVKGQQVASWDEASDLQKDVTRAGIRAVLAKLNEDGDVESYGVRNNGDVLLSASDAASVKAVLRFVFGRNNGEPYPKDAIDAIRDYFWPEQLFGKGGHIAQPLRQWSHLHDIPKDVQKVRNGDGRECVREQLVWKVVHPDDGKPLPRWHSRGPFTEVIDQ